MCKDIAYGFPTMHMDNFLIEGQGHTHIYSKLQYVCLGNKLFNCMCILCINLQLLASKHARKVNITIVLLYSESVVYCASVVYHVEDDI